LDAVGAVLLDGLSYRRRPHGRDLQDRGRRQPGPTAGRAAALGYCQPDGTFITSLDDLRQWLAEMAAAGEAVVVDRAEPPQAARRGGRVGRFRPHTRHGGLCTYRDILGPAGAAVVAAQESIELRRLAYRQDKALEIAHSPRLSRTVGINCRKAVVTSPSPRSVTYVADVSVGRQGANRLPREVLGFARLPG
jgi:hypothetical protein